jgi:hypothetical protein
MARCIVKTVSSDEQANEYIKEYEEAGFSVKQIHSTMSQSYSAYAGTTVNHRITILFETDDPGIVRGPC